MSSSIRRNLEKAVDRACTAQQRHLAYEDLASHLTEKKDYQNALHYYQQTLIEAEKLSDDLKIAKAHRMIGQVKTELAQYDEAIVHLQKYLDMTTSSGDDYLVEQQRAYTSLGRIYLLIGDNNIEEEEENAKSALDLSMKYTSYSLKHCDKLERRKLCKADEINRMRAISLLNLGLAQESSQNIDAGIDAVKVAFQIAASLDDVPLSCRCIASLLSMYTKKNRSDKILELCKEGFQLCKKLSGSERTSTMCIFLNSQADAYILQGHFRSARRRLYEAYKLGNPDEDLRVKTEKNLKTVVAMEKTKAELDTLPTEKFAERAKCNELLGDGYASMGFFKSALLCYEDQLVCLQEGCLDCDLRPCYASLGQTAMDCAYYEKAISYFEKEIELCTPAEASSSYVSIGHCQARAGMPPESIIKSYRSAYEKAVECGSKRRQENALKFLEEQQRLVNPDSVDETRGILEQLQNNCSSSQSSSEDEKNTQEVGDDVDLDLLSDCGDSSDEDLRSQRKKQSPPQERLANRPKRKPRRQFALWRNEKGETKLHLACMQGNLKNVKIFLREGCDIDVMDHAGWTPLHEACNHNHMDVVRFLVESGADVNHGGGKDVGGLTPLHDAASAGSFDVINLLLDCNASVTKLTDDGETVLDMLEDYYQRTMKKEGFTDLELQNYLHVKDRILGLMEKAGFKREFKIKTQFKGGQSSKVPSTMRNSYHNKTIGDLRMTADNLDDSYKRKRDMRALSPIRRRLSRSSSSSSRSSSPASGGETEFGEQEERFDWTNEYKKVISDLRHRNMGNEVARAPCKPIQPLLNPDEVVDEWLDDDLGINSKPQKKRKTTSEMDEYLGQGRRRSSSTSRDTSRRQSRQKLSLSASDKSQTFSESGRRSIEDVNKSFRSSSPMDLQNDENRDLNASVMHIEDADLRSRSPSPRRVSSGRKSTKLNVRRVRQSSLVSAGFERYSPPPVTSTQMSLAPTPFSQALQVSQPVHVPVHRVNVKIEDQLLAVPVASLDLSIGWLAEEASSRYYKNEGVRPTLRLKTQDGALLSHDDPVSLLIGGGDVIGDVTNFNLPPIATRYHEACNALDVEHDLGIARSLEASQATHQLRISKAALTTAVLKPVIRAVAMENLLQRLDISQNSLRDEGVLELCEHSSRLTRLQELDLSGNIITSQGLSYLSDAVQSGKFKSLTSVSFSYNDLQDKAISYLGKLTAALPQLVALYLAGCGFTRSIWEHCDSYLHLSNIQILDLSCNALQARGLAGFLGNNQPNSEKRLNPDRLRTLMLVGCEGSDFSRELRQFFERGQNVALTELDITVPQMTDENLAHLLSGLQNATKFTSLRLLSASSLTARGFYSLLERHPPVRKLEVQGGENLVYEVHDKKFEQDVYEAVKRAARDMETLTIKSPCNKSENNLSKQLETAWREVWGENYGVKRSSRDLLKLTKRSY